MIKPMGLISIFFPSEAKVKGGDPFAYGKNQYLQNLHSSGLLTTRIMSLYIHNSYQTTGRLFKDS